jgi:hypothetical protein
MKTYTAIEIHELAKHVCSEYWRRAEIPGEGRSIPDLYAEAFGEIVLRLQDELAKCRSTVAAERGMVVPDDAPRMWAVRDCGCPIDIHNAEFFPYREHADDYCEHGEAVVRVAIVEIKEDGK